MVRSGSGGDMRTKIVCVGAVRGTLWLSMAAFSGGGSNSFFAKRRRWDSGREGSLGKAASIALIED